MADFSSVLKAIAAGGTASSEELLPFLCQDSKRDRILANVQLAEAYFSAGEAEKARVFIRRAWEFSGFMEQCLPLYVKIHAALNDVAAIREAHKRLGVKKASEQKIAEALACFNDWQYADAVHRGVDSYQYDHDILQWVSALARPHAFAPRPEPRVGRRIRLAYLVYGICHVNSVVVKHNLSFARFHDKGRFEVRFFVPEPQGQVSRSKDGQESIRSLEDFGCGVSVAPDSASETESLLRLAAAIHDFKPDLLLTSAALADFRHCFVAALKPAPLTVGFCQGPPPQFVLPSFDWSISWTKHPLIDCPTDCSLVTGGVTLPARQWSAAEAKAALGLRSDAVLLMSCGRATKFQDRSFWKAVVEVVRLHQDVCFVAVGASRLEFLEELITPELQGRVKTLEWQKDFLLTLSAADVLLDTYPSGGGVTILDAMALGIPVVAFKNNYLQFFTQADWNPAEEFMGMPELLVERGDMEQLKLMLSRLLTDHEYRRRLSARCVETIHSTSGNPEEMVRSCEKVYLDVLSRKSGRGASELDLQSILPPLSRAPSLPKRVLSRLRDVGNSLLRGRRRS